MPDILGLTEIARGNVVRDERLACVLARMQFRQRLLAVDAARRNRVDGHAVGGDVAGEPSRPQMKGGLRRTGRVERARLHQPADVDDAAPAARAHSREYCFGEPARNREIQREMPLPMSFPARSPAPAASRRHC